MKFSRVRSFALLVVAGLVFGSFGCAGADGTQGQQGPAGQDGKKGSDGTKGSDGQKGNTGEKGDPGQKGDTGEKGEKGDSAVSDASINGINPNAVYVGLNATLQISGFGTQWKSSSIPTVTFESPKIHVNKTTVASPTALIVDITLDSDVPIGAQEVKVDGLVYKGFNVEPIIDVVPKMTFAQGSVGFVDIYNKDISRPFYGASSVQWDTVEGINLQYDSISPTRLRLFAVVDVDAPVVHTPFSVTSMDPETRRLQSASGAMAIKTRTAVELKHGDVITGDLEKPFDSMLYHIPSGANAHYYVGVTFKDPDKNEGLTGVFLTNSGKFKDGGYFRPQLGLDGSVRIGQETSEVVPANSGLYFILWNYDTPKKGSFKPHKFVVTASKVSLQDITHDKGDHTTADKAIVLGTTGTLFMDGEFKGDTDEVWFRLPEIAKDKILRVKTLPVEGATGYCDTVLQIYDSTGAKELHKVDENYHENTTYVFTTTETSPYVRISVAPRMSHFPPAYKSYLFHAIIVVEN